MRTYIVTYTFSLEAKADSEEEAVQIADAEVDRTSAQTFRDNMEHADVGEL